MPNSTHHVPDILVTDFLVVGSGLAGLLATLKLAESGAAVVLASKGNLYDSNTSYAQGGLAVSLSTNQFDSPQLHLEDTLKSGCGLVDQIAAQDIIFSGHDLVRELERFGVSFDADKNGVLSLSREGGHSRPRVVHDKDATGRSITSSLIQTLKELAARQKITVLENAFTQSLLLKDDVCIGAQLEVGNRKVSVIASQTVLATGGLGQLYCRTTNPDIATGDGVALAYRAGAALIDMEFVQFHPTVLALNGAPPFLISEAIRGAGAVLRDVNGDRFMPRFHKDGELATRDVVARAILSVMQSQGTPQVLLDLSPIGRQKLIDEFPNILETVKQFGIDAVAEAIPVSPAAHYFMGGIMTDLNGNTTIRGLTAIGECASVGLHGANRLASNSLLEAGVMALRAAAFLSKEKSPRQSTLRYSTNQSGFATPQLIPENLALLKENMYKYVGLIRNENSLKGMLDFLSVPGSSSSLSTRNEIEAANILLLALLVTESALQRRESRGAHYRDDWQLTNEMLYTKRQIVCRSQYSWSAPSSNILSATNTPAKHLAAASNA
jgi:L-aspartate oxidase